MLRHLKFAAAFATAALAASGASAQGTSEKMGVSDALFAATAADGGMTEVVFSEIGVKKATDSKLKQYSEHMIAAHTKANAELKELAGQKGIALPTTIGVGHQFCAQSLEGLSGEEFDCAYSHAQLIAHMATVAAFETEAERGQDPEMKAWAAKTLPELKEHLHEIKPIAMHYEKMKMEKKEKEHKSK